MKAYNTSNNSLSQVVLFETAEYGIVTGLVQWSVQLLDMAATFRRQRDLVNRIHVDETT